MLEVERCPGSRGVARGRAALAALRDGLFPLVVIRIGTFVAPQVSADEQHFKAGKATATAFVFAAPTSPPCKLAIAARSESSVGYLTIGGASGGPAMLNARLAHDLSESVQRAAGTALAKLGQLTEIEPAVKRPASRQP